MLQAALELLKRWWPHITVSGFLATVAVLAKDLLIESAKGFAVKVGEAWEGAVEWFFNRRKDKPRRRDDVTIGALTQKVKYLEKRDRENEKWKIKQEKKLNKCATERQNCAVALAEARTQITDLYLWRKSVEKKIG